MILAAHGAVAVGLSTAGTGPVVVALDAHQLTPVAGPADLAALGAVCWRARRIRRGIGLGIGVVAAAARGWRRHTVKRREHGNGNSRVYWEGA